MAEPVDRAEAERASWQRLVEGGALQTTVQRKLAEAAVLARNALEQDWFIQIELHEVRACLFAVAPVISLLSAHAHVRPPFRRSSRPCCGGSRLTPVRWSRRI